MSPIAKVSDESFLIVMPGRIVTLPTFTEFQYEY